MKVILLFAIPAFITGQSLQSPDIFDAVRKGNFKQVQSLVQKNQSLVDTINENNHSLLILAAYYQRHDIVEFLLPLAGNINHKSENGTALSAAVVKADVRIIQSLLMYNANVNISDANGVTPLMYAIMFNNTQIVELLIKNGANKKIVDNSGKSTFEYAVASQNQKIINLLKN